MEQIAISLRINKEQLAEVKELANRIGISQNALLNVLIDIGLACYGRIGALAPTQNVQFPSGQNIQSEH